MAIIPPKGFEIRDYAKMHKNNKINSFLIDFLEKNGYMRSSFTDIVSESNLKASYRSNSDYCDSFKIIDSDGSILFLPSDIMTPLIISARLSKQAPCRMFGIKECYSFVSKGIYRNLLQVGAIHYGIDNVAASAEAICIADALAKELNLSDYTININDTRILSGIVKVYNNKEVTKADIKSLLGGEARNEMDDACLTMLSSVASASGKITDIKFVADKIDNKESVNGLYNLLNLSELLSEYQCEDKVTYRTGYLGLNDYEEGFVFNLVCDNQIIMHGGRYVYNIDGETLFGIGIKFSYPTISKALMANKNIDSKSSAFDVVLGTADTNLSLIKANKLKKTCMESNLKVNVLYNVSMEEISSYAKKYGIESAIFVDKYGNLEYI